jgi:SAM-dependent methyltransferase
MTRRIDDAEPPVETVGPDFFDDLYAQNPDPWDFATSWYERRKYAITLASLPRERYRRAYEPGCSIGELTRLLAPRCDELLAVDCAAAAVAQAREATRGLGQVRVEQAMLPQQLPAESFDLVVLSELLYFFSAEDLDHLLDAVAGYLPAGGDLVLVHLRASDGRYGYDGFNLHARVLARPELGELVHHEDERFILDVLRRR